MPSLTLNPSLSPALSPVASSTVNESTLQVDDPLLEVNISGADNTQWRLEGLQEGALYRFLLSACTLAGCGPVLAQEGSTLTLSQCSRYHKMADSFFLFFLFFTFPFMRKKKKKKEEEEE
ncbi:hypothetical protein N1851_002823 [Merluccius polli]|uniref:Uncharacterized protein n=1 Tax=Merluccius polli TaxID=89951 RepID=A0AA47PCS1_MERPO|nr:hypothetical protein N1851_002823 [Merluccius polli]